MNGFFSNKTVVRWYPTTDLQILCNPLFNNQIQGNLPSLLQTPLSSHERASAGNLIREACPYTDPYWRMSIYCLAAVSGFCVCSQVVLYLFLLLLIPTKTV